MSSPMSQTMARISAERYMKSTATILRRSSVSDGRVGRTYTYNSSGTSKCRKKHNSSSSSDQTNRPVVINTETIFFPVGTDVQMTDRIQIGSKTYEIQGLSEEDTLDVQLTATCVEVR